MKLLFAAALLVAAPALAQERLIEPSAPDNRLIAEVAIGPRRLLVWELGDSQLAGQFYIEVEGKFLMDDVPSRERTQLRGVLRRYRAQQD